MKVTTNRHDSSSFGRSSSECEIIAQPAGVLLMKRNTTMAITPDIDDDLAEQRDQARAQLLTDLSAGINAMQHAAVTLERLRSNHIYDEELIDGRDGHDIASFVDHSIRYTRAAYAIVHLIIDKGRP
jgi:hypothetical protein